MLVCTRTHAREAGPGRSALSELAGQQHLFPMPDYVVIRHGMQSTKVNSGCRFATHSSLMPRQMQALVDSLY